MAGRITIDVGLNTRDVAKGAKDAEQALGNLEDAVRDTGTGGARELDKLEDELKDVQRQSERTESSLDDVGTGSKRSFGEASENVRNFKDEAVQNLSEVASSFNGDLSQMADGVQGLSGGLASALTPGIGIPVAVLGAAAAAFFASWQQAAEESEQRISDMYADFIESGATFVSEDLISKKIQEIQEDTGKWNDALGRSKETGVEIGTVLRAMAGDQNAIATVHAAYVKQRDDEVARIKETNSEHQDQVNFIDAANVKLEAQTEWIRQIQLDTGSAVDRAVAYRDAMGGAKQNTEDTARALQNIQDRTVAINIKVNDTAFGGWFERIQARAAQGIQVNMRPGQGRAVI